MREQVSAPTKIDRSWLNVPNTVTVVRLLVLAPLFVVLLLVEGSTVGALFVVVVLGATDWIDGWVARRFHQVTAVGRILDPLADRISQIVVAGTMVVAGLLPVWMAAAVVTADIVLGVVLVIRRPGTLPVSWIGRIRTALLMVGLPAVLAAAAIDPGGSALHVVALCIVGLGVILHLVADGAYVVGIITGSVHNRIDAHPAEHRRVKQER